MAKVSLPLCWESERVADAVTTLAKVSEDQADYFLATHAPIKHAIAEKGFINQDNGRLSDQELFRQLMQGWEERKPGQDLSVLIWGEAGTGKSHLITWTKLRLDAEQHEDKFTDVLSVLVRRKNGSLKDALEQIIEQLGEQFGKYLQPVKTAVSGLSKEAARKKLQHELSFELGSRRSERGRDELSKINKRLRHLHQACLERGFGRWLTRDNGVIARTIKLLTEESDVSDRDHRPQFTADDLKITVAADKSPKDNIPDVRDLIDELDSDESLRKTAANLLNEAMGDAIAEMTGLSGGNLYRIFENIRRDLKAEKKRLALFIEDVTAMSVLDTEIVKAVEPRGDESLCPLLAVMGVTDAGMARLRDNDKQRVTHIARLGRDAIDTWKKDAQGLAEFSARYLNAVRLKPNEIKKVAKHRRETGGDVSISECKTCKYVTQCHEAFGKVTLDGVDIGLYPFSFEAPSRLLAGLLVNNQTGIAQTPRGFLENVIGPLLRDTGAIERLEFPQPETLAHIEKTPPNYWTEFLTKYAGDWEDTDVRRARLLAQYWVSPEVNSADTVAQALEGFRGALSLPSFSRKVKKTEETKTTPVPTTPEPAPRPKTRQDSPQLDKMLGNLDAWKNGADLKDDQRIREWLATLIRKSIPWDDLREPPRSVWKAHLTKDDKDAYAHILLAGQISKVVTQKFFIELPRDEETRVLIEALARFHYEGSRTWGFPNGEHHMRVVSRWLRTHEDRIVQSLQPREDISPSTAIGVAVSLLALTAIIRDRKALPKSQPDFVAKILKPLVEGQDQPVRINPKQDDWRTKVRENSKLSEKGPVLALTKRWQELVENLYSRHAQLLTFVQQELELPRGRAGEGNFIDPQPLLTAKETLANGIIIDPLDEVFFTNFWEKRFNLIGKTDKYTDLIGVLAEERTEIARIEQEIKQFFEDWDYPVSDTIQGLQDFLADFAEVFETRKKNKDILVINPEFDALQKSRHLTQRGGVWSRALTEASALASSTDPFEVLTFDSRDLLDLYSVVLILNDYLSRLEKEVDSQETELATDGDANAIKAKLLDTINQLAGTPEGGSDEQTQELKAEA